MYFRIRQVKGQLYLIKTKCERNLVTKMPTSKETYIGAVAEIEKVIKRWREKNGIGRT